jgi:lipid A 4'-phosphatase
LFPIFYQPGGGFPAARISWVNFIYETVARAWILALVWLIFLAAGLMPWFRARWADRRKMLVYLLAALVIGPGLVVNSMLKNHWGRSRPRQ